jgi:CheY-like chemotaxis protein
MDNTKRVLIVEDEQDARTLYVDILTVAGFSSDAAIDGVDALDKMSKTHYDLILLDIIMPNKDGVETLEEITADPEKYGKSTVYMLTNIGSDVAIEKAITLGASGYVLKSDTSPDELVELVKKVLT